MTRDKLGGYIAGPVPDDFDRTVPTMPDTDTPTPPSDVCPSCKGSGDSGYRGGGGPLETARRVCRDCNGTGKASPPTDVEGLVATVREALRSARMYEALDELDAIATLAREAKSAKALAERRRQERYDALDARTTEGSVCDDCNRNNGGECPAAEVGKKDYCATDPTDVAGLVATIRVHGPFEKPVTEAFNALADLAQRTEEAEAKADRYRAALGRIAATKNPHAAACETVDAMMACAANAIGGVTMGDIYCEDLEADNAALRAQAERQQGVVEAAGEWHRAAFSQGSVFVGAEEEAHDRFTAALAALDTSEPDCGKRETP